MLLGSDPAAAAAVARAVLRDWANDLIGKLKANLQVRGD